MAASSCEARQLLLLPACAVRLARCEHDRRTEGRTMRGQSRCHPAIAVALVGILSAVVATAAHATPGKKRFQVEEATIDDIQRAILTRQLTVTELVKRYLERIKAYNGTCVNE